MSVGFGSPSGGGDKWALLAGTTSTLAGTSPPPPSHAITGTTSHQRMVTRKEAPVRWGRTLSPFVVDCTVVEAHQFVSEFLQMKLMFDQEERVTGTCRGRFGGGAIGIMTTLSGWVANGSRCVVCLPLHQVNSVQRYDQSICVSSAVLGLELRLDVGDEVVAEELAHILTAYSPVMCQESRESLQYCHSNCPPTENRMWTPVSPTRVDELNSHRSLGVPANSVTALITGNGSWGRQQEPLLASPNPSSSPVPYNSPEKMGSRPPVVTTDGHHHWSIPSIEKRSPPPRMRVPHPAVPMMAVEGEEMATTREITTGSRAVEDGLTSPEERRAMKRAGSSGSSPRSFRQQRERERDGGAPPPPPPKVSRWKQVAAAVRMGAAMNRAKNRPPAPAPPPLSMGSPKGSFHGSPLVVPSRRPSVNLPSSPSFALPPPSPTASGPSSPRTSSAGSPASPKRQQSHRGSVTGISSPLSPTKSILKSQSKQPSSPRRTASAGGGGSGDNAAAGTAKAKKNWGKLALAVKVTSAFRSQIQLPPSRPNGAPLHSPLHRSKSAMTLRPTTMSLQSPQSPASPRRTSSAGGRGPRPLKRANSAVIPPPLTRRASVAFREEPRRSRPPPAGLGSSEKIPTNAAGSPTISPRANSKGPPSASLRSVPSAPALRRDPGSFGSPLAGPAVKHAHSFHTRGSPSSVSAAAPPAPTAGKRRPPTQR